MSESALDRLLTAKPPADFECNPEQQPLLRSPKHACRPEMRFPLPFFSRVHAGGFALGVCRTEVRHTPRYACFGVPVKSRIRRRIRLRAFSRSASGRGRARGGGGCRLPLRRNAPREVGPEFRLQHQETLRAAWTRLSEVCPGSAATKVSLKSSHRLE